MPPPKFVINPAANLISSLFLQAWKKSAACTQASRKEAENKMPQNEFAINPAANLIIRLLNAVYHKNI